LSTRGFFAFSLLLPAVGALLGNLISKLDFLAFLFFGGLVPYFPVAVILATLVLKATSFRRLLVLSALAPVAFGVALAVFVGVIGYAPGAHLTARDYTGQFLSATFTGGWIAACYVATAWILWAICRKMSWVVNEFAV
jgi:hypothetical protein